MRTIVGALAATLLALAPAAATPTPTPAPTEPAPAAGTAISYAGTAIRTDFDTEGAPHPAESMEVTVTIACTADQACVLSGMPLTFGEELAYTGPSGVWEFPLEGSWCSGLDARPHTVTLTSVTPAHLVAVVDAPGSGWYECDGGQVYTWGTRYDLDLPYLTGDACVIDAVTCPPATEQPVAEGPALADDERSLAAAPRTVTSPTVLSTLATPAETLSLQQCALAALLAVILALLMGFPTHLLGKVSDELGARASAWWRRIRPPRAAPEGEAPAPIRTARSLRGWWPAALGVLAAALIASFIDPAFGFDAASLRQFGSIAIGFGLEVVVGWFVLIWVVGRLHPHATASFEFRPLTLLVVVATVVFTRVSGFQPGIVFGLVAGVAFGTAIATASAKARLALITLGWGLGLAILAWVGYTLLQDAGDALGAVFARETLASLTAAGISALPIALLPVAGLTGAGLFAWNRWVWGGAYAVGLLAFFLVLMPMPGSWDEVPFSLWTWAGMYAGYAAVALTLWLVVTRPWAANAPSAENPTPADADAVAGSSPADS